MFYLLQFLTYALPIAAVVLFVIMYGSNYIIKKALSKVGQ
jgi:hypothetical protein